MNNTSLNTARMLVQVAPLVFRGSPFALKGGTAINLFVRDMPRLSVDLDLVFTDHRLARDAALTRISDALAAAADGLKAHRFSVRKQATTEAGDTKLHVRRGNIEVKVEVNFVLQGTVHPVRMASLTAKAREAMQADLGNPRRCQRGPVRRKARRRTRSAAPTRSIRCHAADGAWRHYA